MEGERERLFLASGAQNWSRAYWMKVDEEGIGVSM